MGDLDRPDLEDRYRHRVRAALDYARGIEDFDDLLDPRHLYDYCLAPEPSKYVLEKIHREEKKMATRYSRDKYARIKNLKSEPLANLTSGSKKRKLGDEKAEASLLNPSVHIAPPSPTPSLEVTAISPPVTRARGKSKIGMNVLGKSLHTTTYYLSAEEKIVMASSKAEFVKAECSQLKKDLIIAMNERNEANQRVKELTESLHVEKALVIQKDEEI
nr:hypothetical protein CFP56_36618 [Quercus suber]